MVISKTPYRISFFGGGTDYPGYYNRYGGATLSTSIDKYCYINVRRFPPFFEHNYRIVYSRNECVQTIDQIEHPAVREILRFAGIQSGMEVTHIGDLPARTGLGSSSAFSVGLLNALYAFMGIYASKKRLSEEVIHIEQDLIKENVGSQDQIATAFGGFNRIEYSADGFRVIPVILSKRCREELAGNLIIVFTGISRIASEIAQEQVKTIDQKAGELQKMKELVDAGQQVLAGSDVDDFGRLLNETWRLKRGLTRQISNQTIDEMYQGALDHGALGGKLLGAGGGGFMLFYVPLQNRPAFDAYFERCIRVPVGFDTNGTRIIYCNEKGV